MDFLLNHDYTYKLDGVFQHGTKRQYRTNPDTGLDNDNWRTLCLNYSLRLKYILNRYTYP